MLIASGGAERACVVVFLIPRTVVLGAILLTGYLGGAVVTHVRIGDSFVPPLMFGVLVWAALYARDARVRGVFPLHSEP